MMERNTQLIMGNALRYSGTGGGNLAMEKK
jgi:hypothetical protein